MAKYLIDVNLPYRFSLRQGEDFIHVKDIDYEYCLFNARYSLNRLALL